MKWIILRNEIINMKLLMMMGSMIIGENMKRRINRGE
jgi:hypothetical protein